MTQEENVIMEAIICGRCWKEKPKTGYFCNNEKSAYYKKKQKERNTKCTE